MRYRPGMPAPGLSPLPVAPPAACLNCGERLSDGGPRPAARFCPACGQETNVAPPTLREFAQQFGGAYFSTEGALWRTLKLLLFRPGELTRLYLAGRRKHYVLPLRLYLTISVLVLLLARLLGSTGPVRVNVDLEDPKSRAELRNFTILGLGEEGRGIGMRDGVFYCNSVPQWTCKRVQRRISSDPKALAAEIDDLKDRFLGNLGGALFILLPSFALGLKLVYRNRRLRYTEHLVFALHVHAFWFLALLLVFTNVWWLSAIGFTLMPVYTFRAMRRVYGGRRWPRLLRGAVVALLYGIVLGVALSVVGLWSMLA
jgi:hypothetical protein